MPGIQFPRKKTIYELLFGILKYNEKPMKELKHFLVADKKNNF